MKLLRTLTLSYVAVLVLTLASSLIAIWRYLQRIADTLRDVQRALVRVEDGTRPLGEHMPGLHDAVAGSADDLAQVRDALKRADAELKALTEQETTQPVP